MLSSAVLCLSVPFCCSLIYFALVMICSLLLWYFSSFKVGLLCSVVVCQICCAVLSSDLFCSALMMARTCFALLCCAFVYSALLCSIIYYVILLFSVLSCSVPFCTF